MIIALVIGAFSFASLSRGLKIIYFQIGLALLVYSLSYLIIVYQLKKGLSLNNQWIYNVYMFLETLLLVWAGRDLMRKKNIDRYIAIGALTFISVFFIQVYADGFSVLANYAFLVAGIVIVPIFLSLLYSTFLGNLGAGVSPEFWLFIGLLLYFSCNAPYFGMIHYIQEYSPSLNSKFFSFITEILGNLRYLLAAFTFIMILKQSRQNSPNM